MLTKKRERQEALIEEELVENMVRSAASLWKSLGFSSREKAKEAQSRFVHELVRNLERRGRMADKIAFDFYRQVFGLGHRYYPAPSFGIMAWHNHIVLGDTSAMDVGSWPGGWHQDCMGNCAVNERGDIVVW